ncbi:hypothetical protein FQN49_004077 [Arthroderma sp. PD_2]|nr:hypothetical protein FQN49_004077 [Arthroderma sp. PD_2]
MLETEAVEMMFWPNLVVARFLKHLEVATKLQPSPPLHQRHQKCSETSLSLIPKRPCSSIIRLQSKDLTMNRLPAELLSSIITDVLPKHDIWDPLPCSARAIYACVSRRWQSIVESHTFKTISLHSDELPYFIQLLDDSPHRRRALKILQYTVNLPRCSERQRHHYENSQEMRENNIIFTRAVYRLFLTLNRWDKDDYMPIRLSLEIESPSDVPSARWIDSRLEFVPIAECGNTLVNVKRITNIHIATDGYRDIHPATSIKLMAALPMLVRVTCWLTQPQSMWEEERRKHRHVLARGLEASHFSALKVLSLDDSYDDPKNHSFHPGILDEPSTSTMDSLNTVLHKISQTIPLTRLYLGSRWIVSPELFWPTENRPRPFWPTLTHLRVKASIVTPDGRYYYTGDDSLHMASSPELEDSENLPSDGPSPSDISIHINNRHEMQRRARLNGDLPDHPWRDRLDAEVFNPLMLSISRAVLQMPAIKQLRVYFGTLPTSLIGGWYTSIECLGPGHKTDPLLYVTDAKREKETIEEQQRIRRFKVWLGKNLRGWSPTMEMMSLWREFAGEDGIARVERESSEWWYPDQVL